MHCWVLLFFLFTVFYFFTTVFAFGLQYMATGSSKTGGLQCLVEFAVVCAIKALEGELFAFSLISKPSSVAKEIGPIVKIIYYLCSCITYQTISKIPCENGPHVTAGLVVWRYVPNAAAVHHYLPSIEESGGSPWLTYKLGAAIHSAAVVMSLIGMALHVFNMNESFDRSRLWKRQTGKAYIDDNDMWASEVVYKDREGGKDEERGKYLLTMHPRFHRPKVLEKFICEDCIVKYVEKEADDDELMAIPKWLIDPKFEKHVKLIFKWWKNPAAIERVNEAFGKLAQVVKDQLKDD
jgi:hypothetical protein